MRNNNCLSQWIIPQKPTKPHIPWRIRNNPIYFKLKQSLRLLIYFTYISHNGPKRMLNCYLNCISPERYWSVCLDCTMCIWNTHDETVISFVVYICVTHTSQSFYLLMHVLYCSAISYSNGIQYVFAIAIVSMYHRFEFSISDFYFNAFAWHKK